MPETLELEADITRDLSRVVCQRPGCQKPLPPGVETAFIHSKNPSQPGLWVCPTCHDYYKNKPTTRVLPTSYVTQKMSAHTFQSSVNHQEVRADVSAAQRDTSAVPVRSIGQVTSGTSRSFAIPKAPAHRASSAAAGPIVKTIPLSDWQFPSFLKQAPLVPGYQEAHKLYKEMGNYYRSLATSKGGRDRVECVSIMAHMVTQEPGKRTNSLVSNVIETAPNIPVQIGANALKAVVFYTLLPPYYEWSASYPLSIDDCNIRTKEWIVIEPREPDIGVLTHYYPKAIKTRKQIFVYLQIPYRVYERALAHASGEEIEQRHGLAPVQLSTISAAKTRKAKHKAATPEISKEDNSDIVVVATKGINRYSTPPPSAGSSMARGSNVALSPQVADVRRALQAQVPLKDKKLKYLYQPTMRTIHCKLHQMPSVTYTELLAQSTLFQEPLAFKSVLDVSITYNMAQTLGTGAFKAAYLGHASEMVFGSYRICVKQGIYQQAGSRRLRTFEVPDQAQVLMRELNCLGWANSLMLDVYHQVSQHETPPHLEIPDMRFVRAGIALTPTADGSENEMHLVEELIEGPFVKYIHNSSASPIFFNLKELAIRAEFLSFAQHAQFLRTKGLAYVSDFQGGLSLLTDPQILTATVVGKVFAEGNANFDSLVNEHVCNDYCRFYSLPSLQQYGQPDKLEEQEEQEQDSFNSTMPVSPASDYLPYNPLERVQRFDPVRACADHTPL